MAKSKPELKKPEKKGLKKAARKQLQSGIAEKFLDAVTNLGHDAERIAKDIKKISKQLAEKLSEKIKEAKQPEKKASKKRGKTLLKDIDETPKAIKISKAAKVVAKVASKGKRPATERDVVFPKPVDQLKTVRKTAARRGFKATITEDIVAAAPAKPVSQGRRRAVPEPSVKAEENKPTNGGRRRKAAPGTQAKVAESKPTSGRRVKKVASEAQPKVAQTKPTDGRRGRTPKVENGVKEVNQEDTARTNTEGASTDTANNETTE